MDKQLNVKIEVFFIKFFIFSKIKLTLQLPGSPKPRSLAANNVGLDEAFFISSMCAAASALCAQNKTWFNISKIKVSKRKGPNNL